MKYIAAYMLCSLAGKEPTPTDIENVLKSVGVQCDKNVVNELFNKINGNSIESLINAGSSKLATIPAFGITPNSSATTVSAVTTEEVNVENEEDSSCESDAEMGFGLFD
jgi:large subunit ribosomal protein LP2